MNAPSEPGAWVRALDGAVRSEQIACIDRVVVLTETGSTQDAARELAAGRPGLLVVAHRQTAGRGRLGRTWAQRDDLGLAATFVLGMDTLPTERLSLAAGLAAAQAVEAVLHEAGVGGPVGLRWPNDVVEGRPREGAQAGGRKIAGVLIEVTGGLALVGIGINVNQRPEDFPAPLSAHATSIREIAAQDRAWGAAEQIERLDVAVQLVRAMDRTIRQGPELLPEWLRRDVLVGTRQAFRHDGRAVAGRIVGIDPLHLITVQTDDGAFVQLPALTTSTIHD